MHCQSRAEEDRWQERLAAQDWSPTRRRHAESRCGLVGAPGQRYAFEFANALALGVSRIEIVSGSLLAFAPASSGSPAASPSAPTNCYGALQSVAWRLRKEGFEATMQKYPDVKVYSRPTEGYRQTKR